MFTLFYITEKINLCCERVGRGGVGPGGVGPGGAWWSGWVGFRGRDGC